MKHYVRPVIYQRKQTFLNCFDYPVCLYLTNHNIPYQFMFSKSWQFYFDSEVGISVEKMDEFEGTKQLLLKELYHVQPTSFDKQSLRHILTDKEDFWFVRGEGNLLPWTMNYQRVAGHHWFLIVNYSSENDQVEIIDHIPEYRGWQSMQTVDDSFRQTSCMGYQLNTPCFNMTLSQMDDLLDEALNYMWGSRETEGIQGMRIFQKYVESLGDNYILDIPQWWDTLKRLIDLKDQFLEFVSYLEFAEDSILRGISNGRLPDICARTINKWTSLRNILMKESMHQKSDLSGLSTRLAQIIEMEESCACELENVLFSHRKRGVIT